MMSSASYLQVCVPAPVGGLSGPLFAEWIERVLSNLNLDWVTVSDIDVAAESRPQLALNAHEARVMQTSTLVSLMRRAAQVVWASLFFCRTESDAKRVQPEETYEESTEKAIATVRVVDASYVYVIGKEQVLRGVEKILPPGAIHVGSIEDMEFPE